MLRPPLGLPALLSDGMRRRLERLLGRPCRPKYDYREQWVGLSNRLSSLLGVEQIGKGLVDAVAEASDATCVALYLTEASETVYRLSASMGAACFSHTLDGASTVPSRLRTNPSPALLPADPPPVTTPTLPATVAVALRWRTRLVGFILLGPQRTGKAYTSEDVEFLATVAEQATSAIVAAQLSDATALAGKLEPLGQVTTATIHDIKNCVSALSLLTRNAASNFHDPEFQRDAIATLSRTVERMRRLLVQLSSPLAETLPRQVEPIDLHALVVEATTPLAVDGKVRLVRELRPVSIVHGDRDALLRVIENLTINAAEAIEGEGTVTVTVSEEQEHAVISVSDTGCGISDEYREHHLFSPFRSTKQNGWGIGLYHTKQVVESQSGEILVESVEGRGTTFTVKLPLRNDVESPSLESVR